MVLICRLQWGGAVAVVAAVQTNKQISGYSERFERLYRAGTGPVNGAQ